ncbi:hypothetical protein OUZ56_022785 [Daphnia magna]|uniref:Uncharacterized protein n=1 Tax=Daphnia magna TaxID=35525 RepID=A0ABR0AXH0_9CRUS|nr:hypothetical protein OUZ56_022785 [Daphnia magna]
MVSSIEKKRIDASKTEARTIRRGVSEDVRLGGKRKYHRTPFILGTSELCASHAAPNQSANGRPGGEVYNIFVELRRAPFRWLTKSNTSV